MSKTALNRFEFLPAQSRTASQSVASSELALVRRWFPELSPVMRSFNFRPPKLSEFFGKGVHGVRCVRVRQSELVEHFGHEVILGGQHADVAEMMILLEGSLNLHKADAHRVHVEIDAAPNFDRRIEGPLSHVYRFVEGVIRASDVRFIDGNLLVARRPDVGPGRSAAVPDPLVYPKPGT